MNTAVIFVFGLSALLFDGDAATDYVKTSGAVNCLALSNNSQYLALGTLQGSLEVWDAKTTTRKVLFDTGMSTVSSIHFHPSLPLVLFSGNTSKIASFDYEKKRIVASVDFAIPIRMFVVMGDLLIGGGREGRLAVYDSNTKKTKYIALPNDLGVFSLCQYKPNDSIYLSLRDFNKGTIVKQKPIVVSVDTRNDHVSTILTGHQSMVTSLAFLNKSDLLVSGSLDKTVRCSNLQKKDNVEFCNHDDLITGIACSRNGARIASAGMDGVKVWDVKSKKLLFQFGREELPATTVCFSPSDELVVGGFCSRDGKEGFFSMRKVKRD